MNNPAMKLATKGTLETKAMIPSGARRLTKLVMLAVIESKLTWTVPAYAKIIRMTATMAIVIAIPDTRFTNCPIK